MSSLKNNYYVNSFFWSTFQKVLNAVVGFVSVPLLLGYYGKVEYGILGIATACNGYMHLLDLGMDTGAVKFYSQWRTEGKNDLISRVARTNITFYGIISIINILGLVALAIWGEGLFSVGYEQFLILRSCLLIIALFCMFSWGATTFNQLLIADMQMAFTMQVQSIIAILKAVLIGMVFLLHLSLLQYFLLLTVVIALIIVPYAIRCKRQKLIDSLRPAFYWKNFKVVLVFSLSIFALSLFQMTATQSRPIILSIFAENGADAVADFEIIKVIPAFIITICGTFSSIFLPKASELVSEHNQEKISRFAYKWTIFTTIIANCLCFPFFLGGNEIITAFVGTGFEHLSIWLILWTVSVLLQVHSTPTNALILAYGKTKIMVYVSALACFVSIIINAMLSERYGVGSAVIGYFIYIIINLCSYYGFYYKHTLCIRRFKIASSFLFPSLMGVIALIIVYLLPEINISLLNIRASMAILFCIKTLFWITVYFALIFLFRIVKVKNKTLLTKYDSLVI